MNKPKIMHYVIAYLTWIVDLALGVWFFLLARQAFQGWIAKYYLTGSFQRLMSVRFLDQMFNIFLGLALLVYMLVSEAYLRTGASKGNLARRMARCTGPAVLLIWLADFALAFMLGFGAAGIARWAVLLFELVAGVAITWFGFRRKPAGQAPNLTPFTGVQ